MAVLGGGAGGPYDAAIVAGQGIDIAAGRREFGLGGIDRTAIGGVAAADLDVDLLAAGSGRGQKDVIAGRQGRITLGRTDLAAVLNRPADQHHVAVCRGDGSLVDNRARGRSLKFKTVSGHELAIGDFARRSGKAATRYHLASRHDHDAILVHDINRTGTRELAGDARRIGAGHSVQRCAGTIVELDGVALTNRKRIPIDDAVL